MSILASPDRKLTLACALNREARAKSEKHRNLTNASELMLSLSQGLRRLALSNKTTLHVATGAVNLAYFGHRKLGLARVGSGAAVVDGADDEATRGYRRYLTEYGEIGGSFWPGAIAT